MFLILDEEDLIDSDDEYNDSSDDSSGDVRSSSSDESPDVIVSNNNTARDDEQSNDEIQHESNTLRRRRKKSRKKKRKKLNSSSVNPDDQPPSPTIINNNNNRLDEINLLTLNDLTVNHHQSLSTTNITTIPINEHDEINNSNIIVTNQRRTVRYHLSNFQESFHHTRIYRFVCFILRQTRKFLRRYRCWRKTERSNTYNDTTDQIPLTKKIYEFYNAPVTKFFQDLIFFILFLSIFTYVALIRTPPKPSVCEWILMIYLTTVAMDLIRELLMMNGTRWKTWLSVYFHDVLHLYDTFGCLMFAIAFGLRLTNYFRIVGRLLLCINLSLWYLRMFHFLVVSKEVGPYIHIAARNVNIYKKIYLTKKMNCFYLDY